MLYKLLLYDKCMMHGIVIVDNQFWYTAYVAVARARLSWWAEPFASKKPGLQITY